jgi:four helix bundle protein
MKKDKGFRKLEIWQEGMGVAVLTNDIIRQIPREESFGVDTQLRKSALSVPSNIAEGWGRFNNKEFKHFLDIAFGSLCELETQLEFVEISYQIETERLVESCDKLEFKIDGFRKRLIKQIMEAEKKE